MAATRTPVPVSGAQRRIGEQLATWRKLRQLTAAQVAERAGISRYTVMRLENGEGASLENLLRVTRALGVLDLVAAALDPYATDLGRLRAQESLPERVRRRPEQLPGDRRTDRGTVNDRDNRPARTVAAGVASQS
jgi:transcriptional regulator with XRE-family HTH domain